MIHNRNLDDGTVLVARYHRETHRCVVRLLSTGRRTYVLLDVEEGPSMFRSPSAAGSAVMHGIACNGWRFWSVEGGESIEDMGRNRSERRHISVGGDRKFGVEIEYVGPTQQALVSALQAQGLQAVQAQGHAVRASWKVTTDGSVRGGRAADGSYQSAGELVSPILQGAAGFEQLAKACQALEATNATVNTTCGLHIHHDAGDFTIATFRNLLRGYALNQGHIDLLVARSRRANLRSGSHYCRAIEHDHVETLNRAYEMDATRRVGRDTFSGWGRYHTLNLSAYVRHGTVEFRQHQGTVSYSKITEWVRFGQAMINAAQGGEINQAISLEDLLNNLPLTDEQRMYHNARASRLALAA